jgi:hypothetical protein
MKQPVQPQKKSSTALVFLIVSIVMFALSIAGFAVFASLNGTIKMTSGKVVDSYSKKEFASRKQTVDQEYDVVKYSIDGKEYTGKTAASRTGSSSQYVTVYYYEKFPGMAWFYKKNNSIMIFCSLFAVLSLSLFAYSGYRVRKNTLAAGALKRQQTKKDKRKPG